MIRLENLCVRLGDFRLDNVNIEVGREEFFVLLGPTGAGKSVILESIAGLVPVKSGRILVRGEDMTTTRPEKRGISICYQDYCLFPHMNVEKNILYGLKFKSREERQKCLYNFEYIVGILKIGHILKRSPIMLSGGEKQRVSIARALIVQPDVLLLDEPLSALDPGIRESVQWEIKEIHQRLGITTIMITHSFEETRSLADKVAVVSGGNIVQCGGVDDIFKKPKSMFTANFVGMKTILELDEKKAAGFGLKGPCRIGIRPENIMVSKSPFERGIGIIGKLISIKSAGTLREMKVESSGDIYTACATEKEIKRMGAMPGDSVHIGMERDDIALLKE